MISLQTFFQQTFNYFRTLKENFFSWSLCLLKSEILDSRAVALEKKGQFHKYFFGIFEIFEYLFLSKHFQNLSVLHSLVRQQAADGIRATVLKGLPDALLYWQQPAVFVSQNRLVHRRCLSCYCEKYYVQNAGLWSSILVTRNALIRNLKNGVFLRRFAKGVLLLW